MRINVIKDLADQSYVTLKIASDLGHSSYRLTRGEALEIERRLRNALQLLEPSYGIDGEAFHKRLQEDEIRSCKRDLSELEMKLRHVATGLDVLTRS